MLDNRAVRIPDCAADLSDRTISPSFDQQKQNLLDSSHFNEGSTLKEAPHGSQRAVIAVIGKKEKTVVAKYGF